MATGFGGPNVSQATVVPPDLSGLAPDDAPYLTYGPDAELTNRVDVTVTGTDLVLRRNVELYGGDASGGDTAVDSLDFAVAGSYWTGAASVKKRGFMRVSVVDADEASLDFHLGTEGEEAAGLKIRRDEATFTIEPQGAVVYQAGSDSAPSSYFAGSPGAGWYSPAANQVRATFGGIPLLHMQAGLVRLLLNGFGVAGNDSQSLRFQGQTSVTVREFRQFLEADVATDTYRMVFADDNGTQMFAINQAGQALHNDGVVGAPGISFASDPDSGLYRIGSNNIGIAVGGARVIDINGSNAEFLITAGFPSGSAAAPGVQGRSFGTTGIYWVAGPTLGFTVNGANVGTIAGTTWTLPGTVDIAGDFLGGRLVRAEGSGGDYSVAGVYMEYAASNGYVSSYAAGAGSGTALNIQGHPIALRAGSSFGTILTIASAGATLASGKPLVPTDATGQTIGDATHRFDVFARDLYASGGVGAFASLASYGTAGTYLEFGGGQGYVSAYASGAGSVVPLNIQGSTISLRAAATPAEVVGIAAGLVSVTGALDATTTVRGTGFIADGEPSGVASTNLFTGTSANPDTNVPLLAALPTGAPAGANAKWMKFFVGTVAHWVPAWAAA